MKTLLGLAGLGALFLLFHEQWLRRLGDFLVIQDILHRADVIHVIAGEDYRTEYAIQLYHQGLGSTLFFTGGWCKIHLYYHGEHARELALASGVPTDAIVVDDSDVTSTHIEAERLKEWIDQRTYPVRSVIVVSDPFHMRRVRWTYEKGERILKRPNKYFTNQLIAQVKEWISFQRLPDLTTLREWERQKLADFIAQIESFSKMARLGEISAAACMQTLKTEFGLAEFYREQSRITDDLDQASDEGLLDVIIALAGNYKTALEFFQFICKSIGDASGDAKSDSEKDAGNGANASEREEAGGNEVYLSTIHRTKGKEFRNVVYFNLSQSAADPNAINSQRAAFIEEERRVAYVGATRAKDDLLITFASTKPSEFLREIALNPQYRDLEDDDLKRGLTSAGLHLERARVVLKQLEEEKQDEIGFFRELTQVQFGQLPAWLLWLLKKFQLWRIDRALRRIEGIEGQIKTHKEETIARLEREIHALEEEGKMRVALLGKPIPQALAANP